MKPAQIIAGAVAGIIGAAIWAAIAYFAKVEVGYVAWGIGAFVGVAVAVAGENTAMAGLTAVFFTIISLCGGKFAAVELAVRDVTAAIGVFEVPTADQIQEDTLQGLLASDIVEERESAGKEIQWPDFDEEDEDVPVSETYPKDIWADAGKQLASKSDAEKDEMRAEHIKRMQEFSDLMGGALGDAMRKDGFIESFGLFDVLFFGLAIFTAWGIASRDEDD